MTDEGREQTGLLPHYVECRRCGGSLATSDAAEAAGWVVDHAAFHGESATTQVMFIPTPFRSRTAGWFASVTREGYANGYWRSPRLTRWGAAWASRRMAWWLNRKEDNRG